MYFLKGMKMTKIERVLMNDIVKNYCPSDYKMKNLEECSFKESGIINEEECEKCWFSEVEKCEK